MRAPNGTATLARRRRLGKAARKLRTLSRPCPLAPKGAGKDKSGRLCLTQRENCVKLPKFPEIVLRFQSG